MEKEITEKAIIEKIVYNVQVSNLDEAVSGYETIGFNVYKRYEDSLYLYAELKTNSSSDYTIRAMQMLVDSGECPKSITTYHLMKNGSTLQTLVCGLIAKGFSISEQASYYLDVIEQVELTDPDGNKFLLYQPLSMG